MGRWTRLAGLAPLLALSGCAVTRALWEPRASSRVARLYAVSEVSVKEAWSAPSGHFDFRIAAPAVAAGEKPPPEQLLHEMASGRSCVAMDDPRAFSSCALDLVRGRTPFRCDRGHLAFAQESRPHHTLRERGPAVLVLSGPVPDLAGNVVETADPGSPPASPQGDDPLFVAVAGGADKILNMRCGCDLQSTSIVSGGAAWRPALKEACGAETPDCLSGLFLLARRYDPATTPHVRCYRVPLLLAVLAAQMRIAKGRFSWRGLWRYRLAGAPEMGAERLDAPVARAHYELYRKDTPYGFRGFLGRLLLTPLALAADYEIDKLESSDDGCFSPMPR